jgi:hypothetical protein
MSSAIALGIEMGATHTMAFIETKERSKEVKFPGEGYRLGNRVYWPDGKVPLVGKKAIRAARNHPEFLYSLFEQRMNDDANSRVNGGHSAVELTSVLIREIIRVVCKLEPAIELYLSGQRPRSGLMIGLIHPVTGGVYQTDGFREAGELAGIKFDACVPDSGEDVDHLLEDMIEHVNHYDSILVDIGNTYYYPPTTCKLPRGRKSLS